MSHEIRQNEITVQLDLEFTDVIDAELKLIETSLGELIPALLVNQEEEG